MNPFGIIVAMWFIAAAFAGITAHKKGYSGWLALLASLFISPIIVLILVWLAPSKAPKSVLAGCDPDWGVRAIADAFRAKE